MKPSFTKFFSGMAAFGIALSAHSLTIVPTFDASIVNDPNGAAMMTAINAAIQVFQNNFSDAGTVKILFTNDTATSLGASSTWRGNYSYAAYLAALKSRATSLNDANAISKLPNSPNDPVIGGSQIRLTFALARRMGLDTVYGPDGFDSTIGLNMPLMNLTRPPGVFTNYDLQQVVEHEIDEVLGSSSRLPLASPICPIDLFRYTTNLARTFTTNGDNAYFSADGTNLLARFNMSPGGDYSDFWSAFGSSRWSPPGTTPHPQVQDAFSGPGVALDLGTSELAMLDVIGWTLSDLTPPTVVIVSPTNTSYQFAPPAAGTAGDPSGGSGVAEVRVVLSRSADAVWWNFHDNAWGTTNFNAFYNLTVAAGTTSWSAALPASLADGAYQVQAQAVDAAGNASGWAARNFTIDKATPTIAFSPLTNTQSIFDFAQLGGSISEAGGVKFRINEYNTGGNADRFWDGSAWITNGNSASVYLTAQVTGNTWSPAPGVAVPSRGQTRYGPYFLRAVGTDLAGNAATNEILVFRSAADTTPPIVTLTTIHNGDVITNQSLPGLFGSALDNESGIASVNVYLNWFAGGNILYWNGSSWSSNAAVLPTTYNAQTVAWQLNATLPSGGNLANGSYQVQVAAQNNESPVGSKLLSVPFTVDYHPVYVFNYGSQFTVTPNMNWDSPDNWDVGTVPGPNARVVINGYSPVIPGALGVVQVYGLDMSGGDLYMSGMLIQKLTLSGGEIHGGALTLTNNGTSVWSGGTISGICTISAGATLNLIGSATKTLGSGAVLNNAGTVNWAGPGAVFCDGRGNYGYSPATLNNLSGGLFRILSDGTLFSRNGDASVINNFSGATLVKDGGTNATYFNTFVLINSGDVRGNTGTLSFNDNAGIPIFFNGGTRFYSGGGQIEFAADVRLAGTNYSECPIQLTGGAVTGTTNTPTYTGPGLMTWTGGSLNGNFSLDTNATVQITGPDTKTLGSAAVVNNRGTFTWSGTGVVFCDGRGNYSLSPATFNNLSGGVFRILSDGTLFSRNGDASVINNFSGATLIKDGGTNATAFNAFILNNTGDVRCNTGTLSFNDNGGIPIYFNGGTRLYSGGGQVAFAADVRLAGTNYSECPIQLTGGAVTGTTNTPTYTGPGLMTWTGGSLNGSLSFDTNATVQITGPATKYFGSGAVVTNRGTFGWSGPGVIFCDGRGNYGYSPSAFYNLAGATFAALTDGTVFASDGTWSSFVNHPGARFVKTAGTNLTTFGSFNFNNYGDLEVQQATVELNGYATFNNNSRVKGPGEVRNTAGTLLFLGTDLVDGARLCLTNGDYFGTTTNFATVRGTNGGVFEWAGGTMHQVLNIASNTPFNISGPATKAFASDAVLNNGGLATWTGSGNIFNDGRGNYGQTPCTWNNLSGSAFSAANDAPFDTYGTPSTFNNLAGAIFQKTGGTNATTCNWYFNNQGTVRALVPTIQFASDGLSAGRFQSDAGATIRFIGGTHTLNGAQFLGAGKAQVDGGTVVTSGSIVMGTGGQAAVFEILSGTLTGTGTFTGLPVLNWTGGTIAGAQTLATGSVMNVLGDGTKTFGSAAVFNNAGTVNWTGSGTIFCDGRGNYGLSPCTFNNLSGGIFRMLSGGTVFSRNGDYSTFNNQAGALLVKSAGTNEALVNAFIMNNRGELRAEAGTLAFNDIVNLDQSALLNGASLLRFAGSVTLSNAVTLTGTTRMDGGSLTGALGTNGVPLARIAGSGTFEWFDGTIGGVVTVGSNFVMNVTNVAAKTLGSAAVLNNEGTINWMGPGVIFCDGRGNYGLSPCVINNRPGGTFAMLNGGIVFARNGDYSTFVNQPGALFVKSGGAVSNTLVNAFVLDNLGEVRSTSGALEFNDRTFLRTNGFFTGAGSHLFSAGTHSLQGATRITGTTVTLAGGYFSGVVNAAILTTNGGAFVWSGGMIGGDFTLADGSTMNIIGPATKAFDSAAVFHNRGTIHWSGTGEIWSDGRGNYGYAPITFNNESGGLFSAESDAAFTTWGTSHTFNNLAGAVFRKTGSSGTTSTTTWIFNSSGTVDLRSGTMAFNGAVYTSPASKLILVLSGPIAGTQYGSETFGGPPLFDGTLAVVLTNGYVPTNGQSFTIANYPSRTGQFTSTQFPTLPVEVRWKLTYGATSLLLQVVPSNVFQFSSITNGNFQFTFQGQTGSSCLIEVSTNLVNWGPLLTNTPFNGSLNYVDPQTGQFSKRFYRATIFP